MGTSNVSYLDLFIEEAIEKALPNWVLGAPSSWNVEDRWTGMNPKEGDHRKMITGVQARSSRKSDSAAVG